MSAVLVLFSFFFREYPWPSCAAVGVEFVAEIEVGV